MELTHSGTESFCPDEHEALTSELQFDVTAQHVYSK